MTPFNTPSGSRETTGLNKSAEQWFKTESSGPCSVLIYFGPDVQRWQYSWRKYKGNAVVSYSLVGCSTESATCK